MRDGDPATNHFEVLLGRMSEENGLAATDADIAIFRAAQTAADETPTRAPRERAPDLLREGLLHLLVEGEDEWLKDYRDLLVSLAPYHDCARRLGLDPADIFDDVSDRGPVSLRKVVREFGRRTDVTPGAFGYVVTETPDGPRYSSAPFPT
jgi:hypothetical protein